MDGQTTNYKLVEVTLAYIQTMTECSGFQRAHNQNTDDLTVSLMTFLFQFLMRNAMSHTKRRLTERPAKRAVTCMYVCRECRRYKMKVAVC